MNEFISFILPCPIHIRLLWGQRGWGTGYVAVPSLHPLHGKHYLVLRDRINVHGGLTFSKLWEKDCYPSQVGGMWVFGFDTLHPGDSRENWPKWRVELETENLKRQLIQIYHPV